MYIYIYICLERTLRRKRTQTSEEKKLTNKNFKANTKRTNKRTKANKQNKL